MEVEAADNVFAVVVILVIDAVAIEYTYFIFNNAKLFTFTVFGLEKLSANLDTDVATQSADACDAALITCKLLDDSGIIE